MSKKKHKIWEGDGKNNHDYYEWTNYYLAVLETKGRTVILKDMDGRE